MTALATAPERRTARRGRRIPRLAVALGVAVLLVAGSGPADAAAPAARSGPQASASFRTATATASTLTDRFSREVVRPGARDADPYHIAHVYELQYRLRWLGLFRATPTGYFGEVTERAVKRFQRRNDLRVTGVVNAGTWRPLIRKTVRGRRAVPDVCGTKGWHACYDRSRHQVNLYRDGTLLNSWLVRGGSYSTPTRTGDFVVYWRDIDHVSATFDGAPMPYSQFFNGGQALHGSRLMMDPFVGHSHGCVNFWTEDARQLWQLTSTTRLHVHVYGAWD